MSGILADIKFTSVLTFWSITAYDAISYHLVLTLPANTNVS